MKRSATFARLRYDATDALAVEEVPNLVLVASALSSSEYTKIG